MPEPPPAKTPGDTVTTREFNTLSQAATQLFNKTSGVLGTQVTMTPAGMSITARGKKRSWHAPMLTVKAVNIGESDLAMFSAAQITWPLGDQEGPPWKTGHPYAENIWDESFVRDNPARELTLECMLPTISFIGRWGITLEAITAGAIGRIAISGVVPCRVSNSAFHLPLTTVHLDRCDVLAGRASVVVAPVGAGKILWALQPESGGGNRNPEGRFAIVQIGGNRARGESA